MIINNHNRNNDNSYFVADIVVTEKSLNVLH